MGLILPFLLALGVAIWLSWTFGDRSGPKRLERAVKRGLAGVLLALAALFLVTGRIAIGVPLAAIALSIWRPPILERFSGAAIAGGTVAAGRFKGRSLDQLSPPELMLLYREVAARPRDRSALEAYLDRRMPGWRIDFERNAAGGAGSTARPGAMTDQKAYEILGLAPGAGEAEIRAAYRRLMKAVHPDQGGSTFLAAQINEAKERLLGRHR